MSTLDRVRRIVSKSTGRSVAKLTATTALDQDLRLVGDDIEDLAEDLAAEFGDYVFDWPWQRFGDLNEGTALQMPFLVIWRLLTWPWRKRLFDPSPYERRELGHVAAVLDRGEWFEP